MYTSTTSTPATTTTAPPLPMPDERGQHDNQEKGGTQSMTFEEWIKWSRETYLR